MPLDIGVGILLSLGVAQYFGIEATPFFIVLGVAAALLPDIDIITIPLLGKWHHRTYTHYPLLYLPLSAILLLLLPAPHAFLLALGVYAHLIHDTFGIGWGIAWLWPFSNRRLLFLKPNNQSDSGIGWVRHYYFRPNAIAYIEYGVLAVALIAIGLHFL